MSLEVSGSVVSLSGSNPMCQEAMDYIRQTGLVIYLDVRDSDILERLGIMKISRIVGQEVGIPMQDILKYRRQFYEKNYDIRILAEEIETPNSIMDKICNAVHDYFFHSGYVSTREDVANGRPKKFSDAMLEGLAWDGGLYVPVDNFPVFTTKEWERLLPRTFAERALRILEKWIHPDEIHPSELSRMINKAYGGKNFASKKVFPVERLDKSSIFKNQFILELFHGPTASFKDAALQLSPMMMEHAIQNKGNQDARYGYTDIQLAPSSSISFCKKKSYRVNSKVWQALGAFDSTDMVGRNLDV